MSAIPYSSIDVTGQDAFDFLQGQLTNDLGRLESERPLLSAWCNPKGRVICLFHCSRSGDGFVLALPAELADAVTSRMTMFRFRAKVDLNTRPATGDDLGVEGSFEDWRLENLRAGIAEIRTAQSEEFTAHMLNLDKLGAVSLDKGCYTGQEIIARTHYRGASKRRLYRYESDGPVAPGDKVLDGESVVGQLVNAIGRELLAVVSSGAAERELRCGDSRISLAGGVE